jgi:CheY-like chemotaxis protein
MGERVLATSENISRRGAFVRTTDFLPVGDVVELSIHLSDTRPVAVVSRVVHVLSEGAAAVLGREPGMGFEFLESDPARIDRLNRGVDKLLETHTAPGEVARDLVRVVVADSSTRLLERLSSGLSEARFAVTMATNGAEAYAACLGGPQDLLFTADTLPILDGWGLVRRLRAHPVLAHMPVVMMSYEAGDIARLNAYRLGVKDFIKKPFTEEEVALRLRSAARPQGRTQEHVILRGKIAELGLGTLLSLLEFERKSGLLIMVGADEMMTLYLAEGRVVKIDPVKRRSPRESLLELLDWTTGTFEFILSEVVGKDEVDVSTTQLLLEHARRRDEAAR